MMLNLVKALRISLYLACGIQPFEWICIFGYNVRCKTSRFPTSSLITSTLSTIDFLFSLTPKSLMRPVSVKIPIANDETDCIGDGKCFGATEELCITGLKQRPCEIFRIGKEAGTLCTLCACLLEREIMLSRFEKSVDGSLQGK